MTSEEHRRRALNEEALALFGCRTRRRALRMMALGQTTASQVAESLGVSEGTMSHHMNRLARVGLVVPVDHHWGPGWDLDERAVRRLADHLVDHYCFEIRDRPAGA